MTERTRIYFGSLAHPRAVRSFLYAEKDTKKDWTQIGLHLEFKREKTAKRVNRGIIKKELREALGIEAQVASISPVRLVPKSTTTSALYACDVEIEITGLPATPPNPSIEAAVNYLTVLAPLRRDAAQGRPPKPPGMKRANSVTVKLTDAELGLLDRLAKDFTCRREAVVAGLEKMDAE